MNLRATLGIPSGWQITIVVFAFHCTAMGSTGEKKRKAALSTIRIPRITGALSTNQMVIWTPTVVSLMHYLDNLKKAL